MRILLTGASGLFGLNFATAYSGQHSITGVVNQQHLMDTPFQVVQVELSKAGAGSALVEQMRPDLIINCAALANLDKCESSPDLAQRLNAELPGELAQAARQVGAKLVHFSTDAVFDGQRGNYSEDDEPTPINIYSRTRKCLNSKIEHIRSALDPGILDLTLVFNSRIVGCLGIEWSPPIRINNCVICVDPG